MHIKILIFKCFVYSQILYTPSFSLRIMKKQTHAKKQVKKEEKQEEAFQTTIPEGKWKGTVLIIVLFLGALAFVYTLSNDRFSGVTGNVIAEKYKDSKASESFLETLSVLDGIDAKYNISLADYKKGYIQLKNEPRYPQPFNIGDIQKY